MITLEQLRVLKEQARITADKYIRRCPPKPEKARDNPLITSDLAELLKEFEK